MRMVRALGLGLVLAAMTAGHVAQAQTGWTHALEWEHDGTAVSEFRVCVDGRCEPLVAQRVGGVTWRAPLPLLLVGEHRLAVEACNSAGCAAGSPELFVRVEPVAAGPPTPLPPPPDKAKSARRTGGRAVQRHPD